MEDKADVGLGKPLRTGPWMKWPWLKLLLAASLALNLGGLGVVAGMMLRHGGPSSMGVQRDLGLGPLGYALNHQDWQVIRPQFLGLREQMKEEHRILRAEYDQILVLLRSPDLDTLAFQQAMGRVADLNTSRLQRVRDVIGEYVARMDAPKRAEFADRLEKTLTSKSGQRSKGSASDKKPHR